MSLRSRAFLTGMATGFFRANNERRERMAERMQQLTDNKAALERERAKSEYDRAIKAADDEKKELQQLRAAGHIDPTGQTTEYTDAYWRDQTYDLWKQSDMSSQEEFIEVYKQGKKKGYDVQFKDAQSIQGRLGEIYTSIDNRQREAYNRPILTGFDKMLGRGIVTSQNAVASLVNNVAEKANVDVRMKQMEVDKYAAATQAEMEEQAKNQPVTETINPAVENPVVNDVYEDRGEFFSAPVPVDKIVSITSKDGETWSGDNYVDNAVEVVHMKDGVKITETGTMTPDGRTFVPDPSITTYRKPDTNSRSLNPYEGAANTKIANDAQTTLGSANRVIRSVNNIVAKYTGDKYGSEKVFDDFGEALHAMTTVLSNNFRGGVRERDDVLNLMKNQKNLELLPSDIRRALADGDEDRLRELTNAYANAEYSNALRELKDKAFNEDEEEFIARIQRSQIKTELQPMVRDLLRLWSEGDKKPAWGAVENVLKDLNPTSTSEELMGALEQYKVNTTTTTYDYLGEKFDVSIYSPVNSGFIPNEDGKEFYRNPVTGVTMMVLTGTNAEGQILQYYVPSDSRAIYEVPLPTKGKKTPDSYQRMFNLTKRMMDQFTEQLNYRGYPIN